MNGGLLAQTTHDGSSIYGAQDFETYKGEHVIQLFPQATRLALNFRPTLLTMFFSTKALALIVASLTVATQATPVPESAAEAQIGPTHVGDGMYSTSSITRLFELLEG
ncbi:hypothetical protein L218DRAFT_1010735 [Marasmius fiardii PR-910]|nr:hypothetical protein L218DRAFT_1010735 [Marasmius fiardii PR-910]